jgi:hypothetical protein
MSTTTPTAKFAKDKGRDQERLTAVLTVRVTATERAVLERAAAEHGVDIADIFREGLDLWFASHQPQRKSAK